MVVVVVVCGCGDGRGIARVAVVVAGVAGVIAAVVVVITSTAAAVVAGGGVVAIVGVAVVAAVAAAAVAVIVVPLPLFWLTLWLLSAGGWLLVFGPCRSSAQHVHCYVLWCCGVVLLLFRDYWCWCVLFGSLVVGGHCCENRSRRHMWYMLGRMCGVVLRPVYASCVATCRMPRQRCNTDRVWCAHTPQTPLCSCRRRVCAVAYSPVCVMWCGGYCNPVRTWQVICHGARRHA